MPGLEIIKPGLLTSVQDLGRRGVNYYAIPGSGAMDVDAAKIALLLLRQPLDCPLIECTSLAPTLLFHEAVRIVLTGADFNWHLDQQPVQLNTVLEVKRGAVLTGQMAQSQLRGYIAVEGRLKLPKVYGSYATNAVAKFGGKDGRLLQKGDVLEWETSRLQHDGLPLIPIHKGPEFDWLSHNSKAALTTHPYQISLDSNRMGARLIGEKLNCSGYQLESSRPVLPGFIQLPPGGTPIVLLQDGQLTGGYPRIAYIPSAALSRFNQLGLKEFFTFQLCPE